MRQFRITTAGSIDNLVLAEADVPKPGPRQALVRVRATSLNYRDLAIIVGRYGMGGTRDNLVPLSDGAGEVVEVGPDVTRVKPGDRVAAIFTQRFIGGAMNMSYLSSTLGSPLDGMLSEYALLDDDGLVKIPEHLTYEEAASFPCAGVTAWNALYGLNPLEPGQTVLVLGTGGVSIFGLQFARAGGARVIVTSSSDEKLERAKELGASDGINYKTYPEWHEQVLALTGGEGVDHIIEVGGGGTLQRSIGAVRPGGVVSLIGVLSFADINPMEFSAAAPSSAACWSARASITRQ